MDDKYRKYAKERGGVQLAALQEHFKLNYRDAKKIVDGLVVSGYLVYQGGLDYKYAAPTKTIRPLPDLDFPSTYGLFDDGENTADDGYVENDFDDRNWFSDLPEENRRRLFDIFNDNDGDNGDDEDDDEDSDGLLDDEEPNSILSLDLNGISALSEIQTELITRLCTAVSDMIKIKSQPLDTACEPDRSLWKGENLDAEVFSRIEKIILSDRKMGLTGAIKKAENYLDAVRDTRDRKTLQLYEHIVYRLKTTTRYQYDLARKFLFSGSEQ